MQRGMRWGVLALLLGGCHTWFPGPPTGRPPARLVVVPVEEAPAARVRIRVDPIHGAAFPETEGRDEGPTRVEAQEVSHDLGEGRTTVWVQVTLQGPYPATVMPVLTSRQPEVVEGLPPAWSRLVPGEVRRFALTFENPTGDGFAFDLALRVREEAQREPLTRKLEQVAGATATAGSSYGALVPVRAIDADAATQWACAEWRPSGAWLAVDLGAVRAIDAILVKLPPFGGGASYRVEASADGMAWEPVTGPLRNTSWQAERKPFARATLARHVRLVFVNDPITPEARFSVFSLAVPPAGSSPAPTAPPSVVPTPTPAPSSPPTPTTPPSPLPSGTPGLWSREFEGEPAGTDPADWVDPRDEGFSFEWMPRVTWRLVDTAGSRQYMHDGLADRAYLSFRRYRGRGFGTDDGRLPGRYFTELDVTPLRSYTYAPTGDQGTQVYYVDPTNYVEVLIKPTWYEVWAATNAAPFQSRGWARLFAAPVTTAAGQRRRLGAEVDAVSGRLGVFLDGVSLATVTAPMAAAQPHWLALRGAGNIVLHDNIRVQLR